MFGLIFFSACFTNLFSQTDDQNSGSVSSSFLVKGNSINFEFHQITDRRSGYTLQSNSSPQQLWLDLNNPEFLHAVFTNSQETATWSDRTCIYFGSTDMGNNWFELGSVPDTSRAGFPAIYGTSDGAAVIANHSSYFDQTTRTGIFLDSSTFRYQFAAYDPGVQPATIWPRCIVTSNNKVLIAAHSTGVSAGRLALNTFDPDSGRFSGWQIIAPTGAETYSLSVSNGGKIGVTFLGDGIDDGDVFYFESSNNGITWSPPLKIFDCPAEQGTAIGSMRGINLNFYGEEPCVVFEVVKQDFNAGTYFPREPNEIHFWSPNVNGGISQAIADSNNVPFAPNLTSTEVFTPLCRPVIGRSQNSYYIFVAFSAATEDVFVGADSSTYFAGYFMLSTNGGETWGYPNKFTPDTPLLDWKYISIAHINPSISYITDIHMILQADSLEGSPNPQWLSANYYHTSTVFPIVNVDKDPITVTDFKLEQNYPNPFNPTTTIIYQLPEFSFVTIKVYDVLGNEIATLVNEEKPPGEYEVDFNSHSGEGRNLTSGIYFYQLKAVDPESSSGQGFVETMKMILLK